MLNYLHRHLSQGC